MFGVGYRAVQTMVHSNSTACSTMQYAEGIAPQQKTKHCLLEQFYGTADCYNTVHVRYGKVE